MPQYEYECEKCKHCFEDTLKMTDPNPPCPECKSDKVKKVPSQGTFHLKGGCWYSDGYSR